PSTAAARAAKFIATLRPTGTRNKKQARHRWRRACYRAFRRSSAGLRHLACRQAARAHPHVHALTGGRHDTDPPQVRQPGARRLVIGVADVLAERLSLVANVANAGHTPSSFLIDVRRASAAPDERYLPPGSSWRTAPPPPATVRSHWTVASRQPRSPSSR